MSSFMISDSTSISKKEGEKEEFDTISYTIKDSYYNSAYEEIVKMLEGKDSLSFKRAEFLVEWAYLNGEPDYNKYCSDIDSVVFILRNFIRINNLQQYKTAGNFALFEYFTKPNLLNGNKPFKYDFEDFAGEKDFSNLFITKVIKTHTGQCTSLPMYYKILSDELGAESFIALAPSHMYIKHVAENGKWVNIELTNGHFATDAWMISSMDISAEAIKNRVYLDALSNEQSIAFMLYFLASSYKQKYERYDEFTLNCVNEALKYFPHCMPALFVKFNSHKTLGLKYIEKYGQVPSDYISRNYKQYKTTQELIENLGYREISPENYELWLQSMDEEIEKQKKE